MGGHTSAILDSLGSQGHLTSIDKDSYSEEIAIKLSLEDKRMRFISGSFGNLEDYFEKNSLDGVLLDLGISSNQLDDPDRGFSFKNSGPLDMRMDQTSSLSAEFWINNASKEEIEKVFKEIAEERQSRKITRLICSKRVESPIKTTKDLVNIVLSSRSGTSKIHTLRNIFRAIRMKVNCELEELSGVLKAAGTVLKVGGRLLVISFHSLEDRTTKRFIQGKDGAGTETIFKLIGGKPLKPDQLEIDNNPRSRSAILRIAEKVI
ncbi:16S rRNA (cytosine(1402)-N(4))-methyltransferase RsmH [Croceibacter atlanticus]|uniref:16S rRNA (cytosine(1402)-N(4))-methyltransferase RsmH n=1 Tax=Croceibacter atlanticus TaxID=313588 RepID=UPI0032B15EFD